MERLTIPGVAVIEFQLLYHILWNLELDITNVPYCQWIDKKIKPGTYGDIFSLIDAINDRIALEEKP